MQKNDFQNAEKKLLSGYNSNKLIDRAVRPSRFFKDSAKFGFILVSNHSQRGLTPVFICVVRPAKAHIGIRMTVSLPPAGPEGGTGAGFEGLPRSPFLSSAPGQSGGGRR